MKSCALLSMDSLQDFECYDSLVIEPLKKLGWNSREVSWREQQVDWNEFDAVIIRSPWDYQDHSEAFLKVLSKIDQSNARLLNGLDLVKWNISKNYLKQLEEYGVLIVPTLWGTSYTDEFLLHAFEQFATEKLIIKPCISANADDTYRLNKNDGQLNQLQLETRFNNRQFMLQPFMSAIIDEGEFSLFYFNGEYSHAILKKPKINDFRVQEEHGGQLISITPEKSLLSTAALVLQKIPFPTLYARLDFVRHHQQFALMEAELIEPSLYFNMDSGSPERFANAFVEHYQSY